MAEVKTLEHEYCKHGVCRKCEPCGKCEGTEVAYRALRTLDTELLHQLAREK
jgi:NADH:ubiquinone oxidoreductase subunit F (NADH-binding)